MDIQNFLRPDKDQTEKDDKSVNNSDIECENESQSDVEDVSLPPEKPLLAVTYRSHLAKTKRAP